MTGTLLITNQHIAELGPSARGTGNFYRTHPVKLFDDTVMGKMEQVTITYVLV